MAWMRCDVCHVGKPGPFAKVFPGPLGYAWACHACFIRTSTYSTDPQELAARWLWAVTGRFPQDTGEAFAPALPSTHTDPPGGI